MILFAELLVAGAALAQGELDFLFGDETAEPSPAAAATPSPTPVAPEAAPEVSAPPQPASPEADAAGASPTPVPPEATPAPADAPPPAASVPRRRAIEEVIVTAQKSEESLRDVPISMTVMDGEFLVEQNVTDYRDLALYAPNAHVDPGNGLFPDINVRGFGSALSNKAFEQSVGLAIDGIPYGRAAYFQGALFDVERVEVLRGPQGTLFGKNTTAGLFNVTLRKPTDELEGYGAVEIGELNRRRFEGAIGGPVVAGLVNFRLSAVSEERDGLVRNTTSQVVPGANETMNRRDRLGFRAQLGFPDLLGASFNLLYEHVDADFFGIGWEAALIPEQTIEFYENYDPRFDRRPGNHRGSVDHDESNENPIDTFVATGRYAIGPWEIDAVGGYSFLKVRSFIDDDFGPAPMIWNTSFDDDPQTTFEIRLGSPSLAGFLGLGDVFGFLPGDSDFIAGFFFQQRDIVDSELGITLNVPVLGQFAAANNSPPGTPLRPIEEFQDTTVDIPGFGMIPSTGEGLEEATMFFNQETTSLAGFLQTDWRLTHQWTLQYGMRLAEESKKADWDRQFTQGTGAAFTALGGEEFTASRERSEFAFTPKVALRYDWTDEVNAYGTWGLGFKAGGFNEQTFNDEDESLSFAAEEAEAWEIGSRLLLLDGTATVNLALFWEEIANFQVLTLPPNSVATTVVNAGEARARGVELDSMWLATDWLTLIGTLAFNDSEFLSFVFGQCSFDRSDTDGNGDGRCDVTGEPLFRTPKWQAALLANTRTPLASFPGLAGASLPWLPGIDLTAGFKAEWQDVQYLERTYDERVRQSPFFRFGADLGLANAAQGWSAKVAVENLTDEDTYVLRRDVPLGGGNFYQLPEPPRLFFATFRLAF